MKTKNTLVAFAFLSLGVGVLVLPQYVGGYFAGQTLSNDKDSELTSTPLADDQEKLEGTLFGVTAKSASAVKETSLHLSLMGTAPSNDADTSFAVILVNGKIQKLVSVGESVVSGVSLYQVSDNFVLINRNGSIEKLSYSTDGSNQRDPYLEATNTEKQEVTSNSAVVAKSYKSQNVLQRGSYLEGKSSGSTGFANQMKTFVENKLIHHYQDQYKKNPEGTLSSFGVKPTANGYLVGSGSPLLQANLKVGDVVESVNGIQANQILSNPSEVNKIRAAGMAIIQIERNGSPMTITYNF